MRILLFFNILAMFIMFLNSCSKEDTINETVKDIDGNIYKTVTIGTQVWMAENLKTTKYRNGNLIGTTTATDIYKENSPKYQWAYDGNENNVAIYGRLYTWHAATDTRNIAPTGWHVPNSREWEILIDFLGGTSIAGGKLKAKGTSLWFSPNAGATNKTGFTALPGGFWVGGFMQIRESGAWWSVATPNDYPPHTAYTFALGYLSSFAGIGEFPMQNGFSVRCIKD